MLQVMKYVNMEHKFL